MNRMLSIIFIFLPTHLFALTLVDFASAADKPNIIIFLADDLGYADIGVNGCKDIPTPHVDAIAKGGVRFTDGADLDAWVQIGVVKFDFQFEFEISKLFSDVEKVRR